MAESLSALRINENWAVPGMFMLLDLNEPLSLVPTKTRDLVDFRASASSVFVSSLPDSESSAVFVFSLPDSESSGLIFPFRLEPSCSTCNTNSCEPNFTCHFPAILRAVLTSFSCRCPATHVSTMSVPSSNKSPLVTTRLAIFPAAMVPT